MKKILLILTMTLLTSNAFAMKKSKAIKKGLTAIRVEKQADLNQLFDDIAAKTGDIDVEKDETETTATFQSTKETYKVIFNTETNELLRIE